jgi:hypothetical protein
MNKSESKERSVVDPRWISVNGGCVRYDSSRGGLYNTVAELLAQGKKAAIKKGRRTLLDVQVLDEHYANLPAAELKPSPKRKPTTSPAPVTAPPTRPSASATSAARAGEAR